MSDILRLTLPLSVWLCTFSAIYGLQGAICAGALAQVSGRAALIAAWLAAVAIQAALLFALRRPVWAAEGTFVQRLAVTLAVVALVAATWAQMPVLFASTCN